MYLDIICNHFTVRNVCHDLNYHYSFDKFFHIRVFQLIMNLNDILNIIVLLFTEVLHHMTSLFWNLKLLSFLISGYPLSNYLNKTRYKLEMLYCLDGAPSPRHGFQDFPTFSKKLLFHYWTVNLVKMSSRKIVQKSKHRNFTIHKFALPLLMKYPLVL